MEIEEFKKVNEEFDNKVNNEKFYEYDLKNEMFEHYEKVNGEGQLRSKKTEEEKLNWYEIKLFNMYVRKTDFARNIISKISDEIQNVENTNYQYLKKYLLFRYQGSEYDNHFDCDVTYPVYIFYKNKLKKLTKSDYKFKYELKITNRYHIPQYLDTYFSMQSLWGKTIKKLYDGSNLYKKNTTEEKIYIGNDFKWQLEHFDDITKTNKKELKELFKAFDNFAHYYHTIGNIAPCAPGINGLKGFASNCFDRLDLFLKNDENKEWREWYFKDYSNNTISYNAKKLCLENFINPTGLGDVTFLNKKDELTSNQIIYLTNYINKMVELIKDRTEKLKNI